MTRLAALAALLLLALPVQAFAEFAAADRAFTMNIPTEFVAIPPLELYLAGKSMAKNTPVAPEVLAEFKKTHYGFQKPADKWFSAPYMIITLETGKRRTPQDLFMDHVLAEKDSQAASTPGDQAYRFKEKEHIPLKRMHYYKDVAHNAALGKPMVMGVYTYLTAKGFLRVAWFAAADQLAEYEHTLHQAAMSVALSPDLEYKPVH